MGYVAYLGSQVLHDINNQTRVCVNPVVKQELNKVGSFQFTILPTHPLYDPSNTDDSSRHIWRMKSVVSVVDPDGEQIFYGRVTKTETDIYGQMKVTCESALGFLVDSIQDPIDKDSMTIEAFLKKVINCHNDQMNDFKQFKFSTDEWTYPKTGAQKLQVSSCTTCWSAIQSNILDIYGGYISTYRKNDKLYFLYTKNPPRRTDPVSTVELGNNLVDLTEKDDSSDVYTILYPIGSKKTIKLNGASIDKDGYKIKGNYLICTGLVEKYGRIVKCETFGDADSVDELKKKALEYMEDNAKQFEPSYDVKAIDLHFTGDVSTKIRVGSRVKLVSTPLGIERTLICESAEINLSDPSSNSYTICDPARDLKPSKKSGSSGSSGSSGGGGGGGASGAIADTNGDFTSLKVSGASTLSTLLVDSRSQFDGMAVFNEQVILNDSLSVTGQNGNTALTVNGNETVTGILTCNDNITAKTLKLTGTSLDAVSAAASVKSLSATGMISTNKTIEGGNVISDGKMTAKSALEVYGKLTASGGLSVSGDISPSTIHVSGSNGTYIVVAGTNYHPKKITIDGTQYTVLAK